MRFLNIFALAAFLAGTPSHADVDCGKIGDVTLPLTTQVNGQNLRLNGMFKRIGHLAIFSKHVYSGGLYLERPASSSPDIQKNKAEEKAIELVAVSDITKGEIAGGMMKGFEANCEPSDCETFANQKAQLGKQIPEIKKGDHIRFLFHSYADTKTVGTEIDLIRKGVTKPIARLLDGNFANLMVRFWTDHPPDDDQDLKKGALGIIPFARCSRNDASDASADGPHAAAK